MNNKRNDIRELTYIALGVAAIIAGGFGIFQLSLIFPFPGTKYILMAPFLSMMFMIVQTKVDRKFVLIKSGIVFGLIMSLMNLYMGVTILVTSILAQGTSLLLPVENKYYWGSSLFSAYTGFCALVISKYLIGGVFGQISMVWITAVGLICFVFGLAGATYAKGIMSYLKGHIYEA